MKRVYIDYDNTMFDFMSALDNLMFKKFGKSLRKENVVTYDFNKDLSRVPIKALYDLLRRNGSDRDALYEVIKTGQYPNLLGDISTDDIVSNLGEVELYNNSQCLVVPADLYRLFKSNNVVPVVNSGLIRGSTLQDILDVKRSRVAFLFSNCESSIPYDEVYTIGTKPVFDDAYAVIDDDLGYLSRYVDSNSNAFLFLVDKSYNKYEYNPQYMMCKDKVIRVSDVNEAFNYIDRCLN